MTCNVMYESRTPLGLHPHPGNYTSDHMHLDKLVFHLSGIKCRPNVKRQLYFKSSLSMFCAPAQNHQHFLK